MLLSCPAIYRDRSGEEATILFNDGKLLRLAIRGIEFSGSGFTSLDPPADATPQQLTSFTFFLGALCAFTLDCTFPLSMMVSDTRIDSQLHIHVELGDPIATTSLRIGRLAPATPTEPAHWVEEQRIPHPEILRLTLAYHDETIRSSGKDRYNTFDEQLSELWTKLSPNAYAHCCHTCAFSDYRPEGSGEFGNLACFRDNKAEYRKVKNKRDIFQIWPTMTEYVQETFLCPEYERRMPGMGWRG
jgi:hypothetical protein